MLQKLVSGFGIAILSACGGGGGSEPFTLESYDAIAARGDQIDAAIDAANAVSRAELGNAGTATYQGAMFLNVPSLPTIAVLGEIALNVNLGTEAITGEAGNFFNLAEEPAPGRLQVTRGRILGTDLAEIDIDLDGEIRFEDENRAVQGSLIGGFGGDTGELLIGLFDGTGTTEEGVDAVLEGVALLER